MSVFEKSKSYRPFKYPFAVEAEKKQFIDTYWHEGQIDLQDDLRQYYSKDGLATPTYSHEHNKRLLDTLLLFFTQLDMEVAGSYVELLPYTLNNEIKTLFIQQAAKEVRHQRAYALAGETFGFVDADWSAFQSYKEMVDKVELIANSESLDLSKPLDYCIKLVQTLLSEGIGLFAAFVSLLNFKRYGLLIGFNDVNSWSLTDEFLHVENNIKVLKVIIPELSSEDKILLISRTKSLVETFVQIECSLIDSLGGIEGVTTQDFKDYIFYLGQLRLYEIGFIGSIDVPENPIKWMDSMLSAEKHGAFFEKRVTDYTHKELEGDIDYSKYLSLLED